ncbi:MAG: hypothetical protein U0903_05530 [Planctomycetales bacterium]
MPETNEDMTLLELEKLLHGKRSQLHTLLRRRHKLEQQLTKVEEAISGLQGGKGVLSKLGLKFALRTRPHNDKPLKAYVEDVLKANRKGLTLQGLSDKVLAAGYKTQSTKFSNTLYQCVYHAKNIRRDEKSGLWKMT